MTAKDFPRKTTKLLALRRFNATQQPIQDQYLPRGPALSVPLSHAHKLQCIKCFQCDKCFQDHSGFLAERLYSICHRQSLTQ